MTLNDRLGGNVPRGPVSVELDDIQATVLRYRPEPYYGTHGSFPALRVIVARVEERFGACSHTGPERLRKALE